MKNIFFIGGTFIRVLHVIDVLQYDSGVFSFIMNYYREIFKRNDIYFDFLAFESPANSVEDEITELGGNIYIISPKQITNLFDYYKKLCKFFVNFEEPIIVHGHLPYLAPIYMKAAKKSGIKWRILHSHSTMAGETFWKRLRNSLIRPFATLHSNRFMMCSQQAGDFLFGKKISRNKTITMVVPNAIDYDRFKFDECVREKIRRENDWDNSFVMGHVGRLSPVKNQKFIFDVFKSIKITNRKVKLVIIGSGSLKDELKIYVQQLGIEPSVTFTGVIPNVEDYLSGMDVFLLPSFFEGFPIVSLEAQASGLVCFLSDQITKESDINGNTVFLDIKETNASKKWAESINENWKTDRVKNSDKFEKSKYNIINSSNSLASFYKNLY